MQCNAVLHPPSLRSAGESQVRQRYLSEELEPFLEWMRLCSEGVWALWPQPTLRDFELRGVGSRAWRPGTRWLGGFRLTAAQIGAAEQESLPPAVSKGAPLPAPILGR